MNANEYQKKALETAVYPNSGEMGGVTYTVLGLTGEAGEVSNKLKKIIRKGYTEIDIGFAEGLMDELGDVLWYAAALAKELGYSLSDVMEFNIDKLAARKAEGTLKDRKDSVPEQLTDRHIGYCS